MKTNKTCKIGEMKAEYDFSKGVRGKHCKQYRAGHSVRIIRENQADEHCFFSEKDGAVMIDPDVKIHFPNEKSVNKALRSLIHAKRPAY